MAERFGISKVAAMYRISPRTLRFYESAGLLTSHRQMDSRYREYDDNQLKRLEIILLLRRLSFSVTEIAALMESNDERLRNLISIKIQEANRQATEAQEVSRLLTDVFTAIADAPVNELSAREILGRYIYLTQKTERMIPMQNDEKYLLLLGSKLIPLVNCEPAPDNIYGMITDLRETLSDEGVVLPGVRFRDDINIAPDEAVLSYEGNEYWRKTYAIVEMTKETFGKEVTHQIKAHAKQ